MAKLDETNKDSNFGFKENIILSAFPYALNDVYEKFAPTKESISLLNSGSPAPLNASNTASIYTQPNGASSGYPQPGGFVDPSIYAQPNGAFSGYPQQAESGGIGGTGEAKSYSKVRSLGGQGNSFGFSPVIDTSPTHFYSAGSGDSSSFGNSGNSFVLALSVTLALVALVAVIALCVVNFVYKI